MRNAFVLAAALLIATGSGFAAGQDEHEQEQEPQAVMAELIAEHASIQPGGTTRVGVHFEVEEGWHIYAEKPGDAGLPTKIKWSAPFGTFGPLQWPQSQEFVDPGDIRTFGYTGALVLASSYTIPSVWKESPPNPLPISADVSWLVCHDVCIPGKAHLELALPISNDPPAHSAHAEFFEQTR